MAHAFPIVRRPERRDERPVLVTVPHFGTSTLPGPLEPAFSRDRYATLPAGFADAFAAQLYGDLHRVGATVLASPYSRLFVDLNRPRDDFELHGSGVFSKRGVVRTHMVSEDPIFERAPSAEEIETRLARYYDPFHRRLRSLVGALRKRHGSLVVLDGHTAIGRRIGNHQIVLGTRGGRTCEPALAARAEAVFRQRGFEVHHDVPGYRGGHIVRATMRMRGVQSIQIEVNASILMNTSRDEFIARQVKGESPGCDGRVLRRLREALSALVSDSR